MNFFKNNLKVLIGFIVGVILASGITVYAYSYFASDIQYTNDKSVADALNNLYSKISNDAKSITTNGEHTLDKYYKNVNVDIPNEILDVNSNNVQIEQNQAIDNTVTKTYTATEDELMVVCVSETGDSRYTNNITTTGTIITDSENLNTKTWAPEINRDWYVNIRTITIKLTKDDTVTISSYGQCFGSGQYSITHIK